MLVTEFIAAVRYHHSVSAQPDNTESFARLLETLAEHLKTEIVSLLSDGPKRLPELDAAVGDADEAAIAVSLRELDADGLVTRRVVPGPPLRVLYELTERGSAVAPALGALRSWLAR
jgi:DNA-binding HxlR family transcriptional regulator